MSSLIKLPGILQPVDPAHITHLEGNGNYTFIYQRGQPRKLICLTLSGVMDLLPNLIRIHKTYAINPRQVEAFSRKEESVMLMSGQKLPVSRKRMRNGILGAVLEIALEE